MMPLTISTIYKIDDLDFNETLDCANDLAKVLWETITELELISAYKNKSLLVHALEFKPQVKKFYGRVESFLHEIKEGD